MNRPCDFGNRSQVGLSCWEIGLRAVREFGDKLRMSSQHGLQICLKQMAALLPDFRALLQLVIDHY